MNEAPSHPQPYDFANNMPKSVQEKTLDALERIEKLLITHFGLATITAGPATPVETKPSRAEQIEALAKKTMGRRR